MGAVAKCDSFGRTIGLSRCSRCSQLNEQKMTHLFTTEGSRMIQLLTILIGLHSLWLVDSYIPAGKTALSSKLFAWGAGGSGGYRGGGGGGGGGRPSGGRSGSRDRGGRFGGGGGRGRMDTSAKLRFSQTIKIDPNSKAAIDSIDFSEKTMNVLKEKGFEYLTPVQSQSYSYVYSGVDVVARSRTGTGLTVSI